MTRPAQEASLGLRPQRPGYPVQDPQKDEDSLLIGLEVSSVATPKPTGVARYANRLIQALGRLPGSPRLEYYIRPQNRKHRQSFVFGDKARVYLDPVWPLFGGPELFHGLDCRLPRWPKCRQLVTFHDLAIIRLRDQGICSDRFFEKKMLQYKEALDRADWVLTVSSQTRLDLVELLGADPERITATPLAADRRFFEPAGPLPEAWGLDQPYLLFVGSLSTRKNLTRLIQAYGQSGARQTHILVLAGEMGYGHQEILAEVERLGLKEQVRLLDFVSDAQLPSLYQQAAAFVFATLYEGFGIPLLEAMASRTPVVAGNQGSAPEVVGSEGVLVDPYQVESIAEGIDRALQRSPEQMEAAYRAAQQYSWEATAAKTFECYQRLL
ncbi:MAG: glycosyltransferase family 1 protein [bacterium]|nr:glycosyltransferase family 1 protein [bacterium]